MSGSVKLLLALMGSGFLFGIQPAGAVDVNIKITGEIFIPPCTINNGAEIKVPFGEMLLYDVNGKNNAKTTSVSVACTYYQGAPYIRIEGAAQGTGSNILQTTGANPSSLGIALYQGSDVNTAYPLRTVTGTGTGTQGKYGYKITRGFTGQNSSTGAFTFTAVPVKYGSGELKAGYFEATATMSIHYL